MTDTEKQVIIDAVLSALRTNSRTIEQLTPVASLSANDYLEVSGGRKIAFTVLAQLVASLSESTQSDLQTAIDKKELQSVAFTTTQSSATLTIKSVGKTIQCSVPIATSSQSGIITAADKVKLDSAYTNASSALGQANAAKTAADNAQSTADAAKNSITAINDQIGKPFGIAPLDANAKVPAANLPAYVDDVVEFNAFATGILSVSMSPTIKKSTDPGCMVVYNADTNCFVLAVANKEIESGWEAILRPQRKATPVAENEELNNAVISDYWQIDNNKVQIIISAFTCYINWADADKFGTYSVNGRLPEAGKIYTCTSINTTSRWSGSELITIGSDLALGHTAGTAFPGDEGTQLQEDMNSARTRLTKTESRIDSLGILKADGQWDGKGNEPNRGVWLCPSPDGGVYFRSFGNTNFYGVAEECYNSDLLYNPGVLYRLEDGIYRIKNDMFESMSGSSLGNDWNVTNVRRAASEPRQLQDGSTTYYDTIESAVEYAIAKGVIVPGMHLTFEIAHESWKSYIFVGSSNSNPLDISLWQDMAGMSAGSEPVVNINTTCPDSSSLGGYYSLGTALKALKDYEESVNIIYRKKNLIITYRTAEGESEAKIYTGESLVSEDFYLETAWKDFGKGAIEGIKLNGTPVTPMADGTVNIQIPEPTIDETLDETSTNPVQNAAVTAELNDAKAKNVTGIGIEGDADSGYQIKVYNAKGEELESHDLPVSGGGGGGEQQGEGTKIVLQAQIVDSSLTPVGTLREGAAATLLYTFGHQYSTGDNAGQETGADGTLTISVKNGITKTYEATLPGVTAGPYELDLSNILRTGNNSVTIQATVIDPVSGAERRKQVTQTVAVRRLQLASSYDLQNSIRGGGLRPDDTAVIPFTCVASGKKDIHVVIDGVEQPGKMLKDYSATSGEIRVAVSSLSIGRHNVQIYATQNLSDLELQSETVFIDILKAPASGNITTPFIGTKMLLPSGSVMLGQTWKEPVVTTPQFAEMGFDFVAYDPDTVPAMVIVSHNGVETQTIAATRTVKKYTNRFTQYGIDEMELRVGGTAYKINVNVTESNVDISEVTDSLTLNLNAAGRSNSEQNPGQWKYGNITSDFTGFDWLDEGSGWTGGVLRLMNGANTRVNFPMFGTNAATTGLTYEVELRCTNIIDRQGTVLDCMDSNGVGIRITAEEAMAKMDGGETVGTKFAAGEWIRVGFTIEKASAERRLLSLYVDGVWDRAVKFDTTSAMMNALPGITILSDAADVEVRMMRCYNRCLSKDEMLENFIAGRVNTDEMVVLFERNNVLNTEKDDIDIEALRKQSKGMLRIIGSETNTLTDLNYRNDKKYQMRVDLEYYSPYGKEYDFRAENALIQIQGTSSVTYPRKNYDVLFDIETRLYVNGILVPDNKYSFKPGARPVSIWCFKADYCDSSSTHNCGAVKSINDLFKLCGWLTPPQRAYSGSYDIRTGVDSFPVTLYNDNKGTGESVFIGKYNFNNEKKGSAEVYGFEGIEGYNDETTLAGKENPCICLEFLENGHPLGLFQTDDMSDFDTALEFRYPTNGTNKIKWAKSSQSKRDAVQRLWSWVVTCKGNPDKFLAEFDDYFINEAPFAQYVITDYFMAVDDRVKNMMLVTWDCTHWMFIPYDWDCLFGVDNTSHLKYNYDIDENSYDEQLNNYAFAGHDSELWKLVRGCPERLSSVAAKIRANMSVTAVKAAFSTEFDEAWSERVVNYDEQYKYADPAFVDIEQSSGQVYGDYLFALQGKRKSHRNYIIENRFALLDSLYGIGDFRGNAQKVYLFGNFATDPRVMRITAFEKFGFGYSSNNAETVKGKVVAQGKGDVVSLTVDSNLSANDPQNIYGADRIEGLDLTDIADKLVSTLVLSACTRLRDLDLSNSGNKALEQIDLSGCRILRSLKVCGMENVRALDLSKNRKLETLNAANTNVLVVNFATGALTERAALPASIQSVVMVGLPKLAYGSDGLTAESWENLATLQAEQMGAMNPVVLLKDVVAAQSNHWNLSRVKIGGEGTRGDGSELLALLDHGVVGVSNSTKPEVSGKYELDHLVENDMLSRINDGIDGIDVVIIIDAYISAINEVNGELYGGMEEVEDISNDNLAEHLAYYNGETYEEWLDRYERENININETIQM